MSTQHPDVFLIGGSRRRVPLTVDGVGSKAFNLARMAEAGLPVPPALVLGTAFSRRGWGKDSNRDEIVAVVKSNVERLEEAAKQKLGSARNPLVLSVRSGAPVSMPGMMATILNVGLNDLTVHGLVRRTGNPAMAWDAYRRFIEAFGEVVSGVPPARFHTLVGSELDRHALGFVREMDSLAMRSLAEATRQQYEGCVEEPLPQDPLQQIVHAVEAVCSSWYSERAGRYRALHGIDDAIGTGVIIQQMVFGNAGGTSGSGVAFTRNPASGVNELYVDYVPNAQGEDIVSGRHVVHATNDLERYAPGLSTDLMNVRSQLEREFEDLQDFEFTVEDGRLYLLQTRAGQRTPWAALHIAVDLVNEGLIDAETALGRLAQYDLDTLTRSELVASDSEPLAVGVPASVGVAVGRVALDSAVATEMNAAGQPTILVRMDTDTDDLDGFVAAAGVLTARGGRTSHAAVVMRQLGKPCVVGCRGLDIDLERRQCTFSGRTIPERSTLSIDGETGAVYAGEVTVSIKRPEAALSVVRQWRRSLSHVVLP